MSQLGDYIKQYREVHDKMSIRSLAEKCGLSSGYIHKLEKGIDPRTQKPIIPTVETINRLAEGMNIAPEILLNLSGIKISGNNNQIFSHPADTPTNLSKKGKISYDEFMETAKAFFMDASEEDREAITRDISSLYWESKQINKDKYAPRNKKK